MRASFVTLFSFTKAVISSIVPDIDCSSCSNQCDPPKTLGDIWVIPGTHNSGAISPYSWWQWPVFIWAKNQSHSMSDQMKFGVRSLDLRVSLDQHDSLFISHTFLTSLSFVSALQEIVNFLIKNKDEFMLVSVTNDFAVENQSDEVWNKVV